jgi:hypothetical protein
MNIIDAINIGYRNMTLRSGKILRLSAIVILVALTLSCADMSQSAKSARKLTSCPPGEYLICETTQPLSKGGAEEEIPEYEYCRCK